MQETPEVMGHDLKAQLDNRNLKAVKAWLRDHDVADVAEMLAAVPVDQCLPLFRMVPRSRRAEVFTYLPFERQEELLEELPEIVVTPIVNDMPPDDRTRLLEELPFEIRQKLLLRLSPEERKIAWQLLSYPEGSIGRLMTPEFVTLGAQMKVNEVLEMMRWDRSIPDDQLNYLFVTDRDGKYIGDVSLVTLVTADPPSTSIGEIMSSARLMLNANDEQSTAVDYFRKYDRAHFPVVDDEQNLLGIVTADDVFDVAEEEATVVVQQFGGQQSLEDSYFHTPLFTLFRKRAGWLALLFLGGTVTSGVLRHYEAYTVSMAWLVFFLPLIVASGGNTGSQAASLVIRGLSVREMETRDWWKVLFREISVGLGLGIVLAGLGYARAVLWDLDPVVGVVVALSLVCVVAMGAIVGSMLPFFFKSLNLDPAVISSPLLAQTVDIVGALVFYNIAYAVVTYWSAVKGGGG